MFMNRNKNSAIGYVSYTSRFKGYYLLCVHLLSKSNAHEAGIRCRMGVDECEVVGEDKLGLVVEDSRELWY